MLPELKIKPEFIPMGNYKKTPVDEDSSRCIYRDFSMLDNINKFHLIGIGGIGLSGLAEMLFELGKHVQGSDTCKNEQISRLEKRGIKVFSKHKESNVGSSELVVYSNAIPESNPEIVKAKSKGVPIISRAQLLNLIANKNESVAVSGTHGKTTSTGMLFQLLKGIGEDPTIIVGGILPSIGSNTHLGKGNITVYEACEAFGSINHFTPNHLLITNIEEDHMDYYDNLENLYSAFTSIINRVSGNVVMCIDDPGIVQILPRIKKTVITYGFDRKADFRLINSLPTEAGTLCEWSSPDGESHTQLVPVLGRHNVLNFLGSLVLAKLLGYNVESLSEPMLDYKNAGRRFEFRGLFHDSPVFDDYAHHPTEITSLIDSAREFMQLKKMQGGLKLVFQPHLYSRTKNHSAGFAEALSMADEVYILPIYGARETPIPGISSEYIAEKLIIGDNYPLTKLLVCDKNSLNKSLSPTSDQDLILMVGAGDIYQLTDQLIR